jgi:pimeloyl-ACP methyl ester carboxylesterase
MATGLVDSNILVDSVPIEVIRGGTGKRLLVLHDELGFPGWMAWNRDLAESRELVIPMQPGFGRTPRIPWLRSYRDLAAVYNRLVREQGWGPIDVMGFSAGGYIGAEMAAACPELFSSLTLVGPLGCRPASGEIFDFFAVTVSAHVAATVSRTEAPEFAEIYGGEINGEQFEAFQDARAETARLGWEPFMFDRTLPARIRGIGTLPVLLIRGEEDLIVPQGCIETYSEAIPHASVVTIPGVGHRPEIEDRESFVGAVSRFLRP